MKNKLSFLSIPYVVWMALFTVAPIVMVVVYAFTSGDGSGFTMENFANMGDYAVVFGRSFKLAFVATVICVLVGYPVSYMMAKEGPGFQRIAMMLIMLPMWINFLLRTYAWMSILDNNGLLNRLFQNIGLIDLYNSIFGTSLEFFPLLNTQGAVVLEWEDRRMVFELWDIPPGARVLVLEKDKQRFFMGMPTGCYGWETESYPEDMGHVTAEDAGGMYIAVNNHTEGIVPVAEICYRSCDPGSGMYIGGISYRVEVRDLQPGERRIISPYHYASGSSEILYVTTWVK